MSEGATLSDPHVRLGIVAGDGGALIWPLVLGPARAKRYLLTGDRVTAAEAERLGLVTEVVAPERLEEAALAFAGRLAEGAPLALRYTKLAVNQWLKQVAGVAFDLSTSLELVTLRSHDHAEALAALREGRPPRFEGR
jgi:enoyl-CoA hydratase